MNTELETEGVVEAVQGNNNYRVRISAGEEEKIILCHCSGKMRRFNISIVVGDRVRVVLPPPYDRGRITFREKN